MHRKANVAVAPNPTWLSLVCQSQCHVVLPAATQLPAQLITSLLQPLAIAALHLGAAQTISEATPSIMLVLFRLASRCWPANHRPAENRLSFVMTKQLSESDRPVQKTDNRYIAFVLLYYKAHGIFSAYFTMV
jgi:hypothetical protein